MHLCPKNLRSSGTRGTSLPCPALIYPARVTTTAQLGRLLCRLPSTPSDDNSSTYKSTKLRQRKTPQKNERRFAESCFRTPPSDGSCSTCKSTNKQHPDNTKKHHKTYNVLSNFEYTQPDNKNKAIKQTSQRTDSNCTTCIYTPHVEKRYCTNFGWRAPVAVGGNRR